MKPESNRKQKTGKVISNKMEKTVVVAVKNIERDPNYGKVITRQKKYYAHTDEKKEIGDEVTIVETRPLSKTKRWRVVANA